MLIRTVNIDEIKESKFNPRIKLEKTSKEYRQIAESIREFGFVEPLVVNEYNMCCIGGHQRLQVLRDSGETEVSCVMVNEPDSGREKALCVALNKIKGDWDMDKLAFLLGDDEVSAFPTGFDEGEIDLDKYLKDTEPVVPNDEEKEEQEQPGEEKFVECVRVTKEQEEFSSAMLNLLSMDFSMESSYADVLRYNSFMRERNTRETDAEGNCAFGDGFFKGLFPNNNGRDFFRLEGEALEAWKRKYGDKIVDFGAGKLNNTRTLRNAGVSVSAFEPYFVTTGDEIHKEKSLEIAGKFLDEVESGIEYTSVFISSVFNSVPFMADRIMIAQIAAALCRPGGRVVCWCQSNESQQFILTKKHNVTNNARLTFDLDYEPNTILGDISKHPKVQKGHTAEELKDIFQRSFKSIDRLDMIGKFWYLEASKPVVNPDKLAEALDFEFNLPYPDGSTMELSCRAREVFEKRLSVTLPKPKRKEEAENGESE